MDSKYCADPTLVVEPKYYSNGVPVFEPTMSEFQNFYKFNKAINKYGMRSGIVKIVPPLEWINLLQGTYTKDVLDRVCIRNPIVQNINVTAGQKGVFSSQNIQKQRRYSIYQWKELAAKPNHTPPSPRRNKALLEDASLLSDTKIHTARSLAVSRLVLGDFNINVSVYTPERCQELETLYWKSLGYAEPMYGADMPGSVFSENTKAWNVAHLPNLLDLMEEKLSGINDAYLYAGLWKASFSWHLEDQDLYSINYLHFGAPKQWYSIPQAQAGKFFNLMKDIFHEHYKSCPEFLRHKTFLASPQFLKKHGITCNSIVHNRGEFIITYPYGYHAGFNYGFNLAESVNFALEEWLEIAKKARKCECIKDSVCINYRELYCKFNGTPYLAPMSPSLSLDLTFQETAELPMKPAIEAPRPGRKRRKIKPVVRQCALCPNTLPEAMTKYVDFQLLPTENSSDQRVHRICALSQHPPLTISKAGDRETAVGLDRALKFQKAKCTFCHVPNIKLPPSLLYGAGVACSMPKCRRNYHATCAVSAGFTFDENLCKMHRAKTARLLSMEEPLLYEKCAQVPSNSFVQFVPRGIGKKHVGDLFCGVLTANNADEHSFSVLMYPDMTEHMEIHYEDVLMSDVPHLDNSRFLGMTVVDTPIKTVPPIKETEALQIQTRSAPIDHYPEKPIPDYPAQQVLDLANGFKPLLASHSPSFNFEIRKCASDQELNNFVFVNKYSDIQQPKFAAPDSYLFVDNYSPQWLQNL